jgi:hypothetical protein
VELFDLAHDPGEPNNVADANPIPTSTSTTGAAA